MSSTSSKTKFGQYISTDSQKKSLIMKKYPEITLSQKVNEDIFLELSNRIKSEFGGKLINEVADIDSAYKDFDVNGKKLTLHQQVFIGIVIFPTLLEEAKKEECILAEKIGFALKD